MSPDADGAWAAAARRLGESPVEAYGVGLCLALTAATLAWLALGAVTRRRADVPGTILPTPMTRAARIAIAAGLVATAALVFAALALTLGSEDSAVSFDDVLARTLRDHLPAPALRAFAWLTHIGDPAALVTMTGVCGALLWRLREYRLLLCWLLAVGGNALINPALKHVFERARPPHEAGLTLDSGFSFPSGHSSGAMVTYGMLFVVALRLVPKAWHLPALLLAVAAIFTSGSSRIMLQVHFASDVAAGFASGFAWLAICVTGTMLASPRSDPALR